MNRGYINADVWQQKRDDEILQAVHEIDSYTAEAQMLIQSEFERRGLDKQSLHSATAEQEPVEIDAPPPVQPRYKKVIGCLATITGLFVFSITKVLMQDETLKPWVLGAIVFLGITIFSLFIWN